MSMPMTQFERNIWQSAYGAAFSSLYLYERSTEPEAQAKVAIAAAIVADRAVIRFRMLTSANPDTGIRV